MSKTAFKFMIREFKKRDKKYPPLEKIKKTKIKEGDIVLDYGCGPGSYTIAAAEVVGSTGTVYAADIHPLAIDEVKKRAKERGLENITPILTNCNTNLNDNDVDVALFLDILHNFSDPSRILKELHRVLKNNAWLTVDDHHLEEDEIISKMTANKLFKFIEKVDEIFNFITI